MQGGSCPLRDLYSDLPCTFHLLSDLSINYTLIAKCNQVEVAWPH